MEHSESITQIASAVISAQGELEPARKTADNPFFKSKYADLAECIETARPVLKRHGLGVVQSADCDSELAIVETILVHTSGEWIKSRTILRPAKADPQGMGSAITYARRYAYMAIIGMAADDDDGNAASASADNKTTAQSRQTEPKREITRPPARTNGNQLEAKRKAFFANVKKLGVEADYAHEFVKLMFELDSFNDATVEQLREAYSELAQKASAEVAS